MNVTPLNLQTAPLSVRNYFSENTGPLVATMAHVPEILQTAMPMIGQQFGASALSMRHKEMIILGVSALQGCQYCTQTHTVVAHREGLTSEEILQLRSGQPEQQLFTNAEATLWTYIVTVGADRPNGEAVEQAMNNLKKDWMEFEIVEITMLIGTTIMLNRYCIALGIPADEAHLKWIQQQDWL